jgi:hypothetical protein
MSPPGHNDHDQFPSLSDQSGRRGLVSYPQDLEDAHKFAPHGLASRRSSACTAMAAARTLQAQWFCQSRRSPRHCNRALSNL